jgi:signal transduction histidine kinase
MQNKTGHVSEPATPEVSSGQSGRQLEIILHASQRLNAILEIPAVMRTLVASAMELVEATAGMCGLLERERMTFTEYNEKGITRPIDISFKRGEGVPGWLMETRRPYVSNDPEHDAHVGAGLQEAFGLYNLVGIPVFNPRGELVACFELHNTEAGRPFNEQDVALLEGLAAQAAIAIDNARLYQEAQAAIRQREEALKIRDEMLAREQSARAEAEEANRAKDEFLATVSHELRTPLNAMLGWARMLRTGKLNEEMSQRAISTIERNARSQAKLIEDILDVSRIVTGKLRLNTRTVELAPVIEASIDSVRPASDAKAIRIIKSLGDESLAVTGDPDRLQQVVWNLLSNAVKFTSIGGRVEVKLARLGDHVQIRVSDTGQGISPDFLDFVFDRFRQGDSTSTRAHGGLGLGLAIVRHLVEMHGGTVRAESEGEEKGATFTVKLPLAHLRGVDRGAEET